MKRILITGANSYIGTSFKKWMSQWPDKYAVDTVGTRDGEWESRSFSSYDAILHVAGIAHQDTGKDKEDLYFKVNRDLTIAVAQKAKDEGVKQFVFMSSMIVYGASSNLGEENTITEQTTPSPVNFYGESKLQAEAGIRALETPAFKVAIIRPPMIYGKGSRGNYPLLAKFAKKFPVFPNISNKRSMLYIENLTEFLRLVIENEETGIFFPQNKEYVSTSNMVKTVAEVHGRNLTLVKWFNPIMNYLQINTVRKVFGNLVYSEEISQYKEDYHLFNFYESIQRTEEGNQ